MGADVTFEIGTVLKLEGAMWAFKFSKKKGSIKWLLDTQMKTYYLTF